jgi:hypothetical protein
MSRALAAYPCDKDYPQGFVVGPRIEDLRDHQRGMAASGRNLPLAATHKQVCFRGRIGRSDISWQRQGCAQSGQILE